MRILPACIAAVGLCLVAAPSLAQAVDPAPLSSDDLADLRGGYLTAGGITLGFGAVVRTYVDGQLALESRLTWTESGAITSRRPGDIAGLTDLQGALDAALAGGLDLSGLAGGEGLLLSDANGTTALIQSLQGGLRNVIVNNANGRDLRQEIEVTLTLPDLSTMQRAYSVERLGSALSADINAGLLGVLGR